MSNENEKINEQKNEQKNEEVNTEKEEAPKAKKESEKSKKDLAKAVKVLEMQLSQMQELSEAQNKKYLTMLAEYDNFRKRAAKEKEQTYSVAACDTVSEFLPVLDNFERALAFAKTAENAGILEGLEKIKEQFEETFKKLGVSEIESMGKTFDPNFHNAVMHEDNPDIEGENIITDVLQKGYLYNDKVIRYAMVKVTN